VIETPRLILRLWREEDLAPFAAMSADPEVMRWLGGVLTAEDVRAYKDRADKAFAELGMCRWVVERREDGEFLGACGLMPGHEQAPIAPFIDIGWRLARPAWGGGYASEAATAVLRYGFERLGLSEITAITASTNLRSRAVMERIGMQWDAASDFDFPGHEPDDPLRATVVYRASRS
jgi:RimJ/RimL family protein N-acetyltransferase